MSKEKLIVTMELEDFPDDYKIMEISLLVIDDKHWLSKRLRGWKKIKVVKLPVKSLEVERS